MFKLRTGYFISGILTGLILLFSFIWSLPDGKLHLVFCDVGQGDSLYVKFPDGRDMLVDGGPGNQVLKCLGNHMAFWDRKIDLVVVTHPQKDHIGGLVEILDRFQVSTVIKSDINNSDKVYARLLSLIKEKQIPVKFVTTGSLIEVGLVKLKTLWPSPGQIALTNSTGQNILGATTSTDVNDSSIVMILSYNNFDVYLPGDADLGVESKIISLNQVSPPVEILKVPHHGSKTGMDAQLINWLQPAEAIISVGKNSYGHPTQEILNLLKSDNIKTDRTDEKGDIEIVTDGINWQIN